jgi:hypothetical protein
MRILTISGLSDDFKEACGRIVEKMKYELKFAAELVRRQAIQKHMAEKTTPTQIKRGSIARDIFFDDTNINNGEIKIYVGGPSTKPARVHEPLDGRKMTTIRPITAKKLFIPLRKGVLPDKGWRSRPASQRRGEVGRDFVFANQAKIPARPFLSPSLGEMANTIKERLATAIKEAI